MGCFRDMTHLNPSAFIQILALTLEVVLRGRRTSQIVGYCVATNELASFDVMLFEKWHDDFTSGFSSHGIGLSRFNNSAVTSDEV
jgi:hypothetical protein